MAARKPTYSGECLSFLFDSTVCCSCLNMVVVLCLKTRQKMVHFHPEQVEEEVNVKAYVRLCSSCSVNKTNKEGEVLVPLRSIASGTDLRIGLVPPNLQEQASLAWNQAYLAVYKILSNRKGRINMNIHHRIKIHFILFGHNASEIMGKIMGEMESITC